MSITKVHYNSFLLPETSESQTVPKCALVILNSDCTSSSCALLELIWRRCDVIACADGGANRLHDMFGDNPNYIPKCLIGDLDSARPEVLDFYAHRGVEVIKDEDQDHNDLDKALKYIAAVYNEAASSRTVLVVGGFGGRFDQEMSSIQALFKWNSVFDRIVLVSRESTVFLLSPGRHRIDPLASENSSGNHCGLIPMHGLCAKVTTEGLGWNLRDNELEFGKLVSTSNFICPDIESVYVETSNFLLWTLSPAEIEAELFSK